MHAWRQSYFLRCRYSDAHKRGVQKELGKRGEIFGPSLHHRSMQARLRDAVDNSSNFAPLRLEMSVTGPKDNAAAETVISLISGKCLMSGIVDEEQEIVGFGH